MLSKAQINAKPKKTLVLMGTLRKLGKKDQLEKKSKESLVSLIYSKQKGKKPTTRKKVSGTKNLKVYTLDINMNNEQPLSHTDSAHRMINQILKAVTIINAKHPTTGKLLPGMSIPMPKSSIIPIKFSAVLDGIGGFVIGNVFKVKKDKLPKAYQNKKIAFAILNESQKVTNGQDWTTTIGGSIILQDTGLKRDDDGEIPNYIPIHNPIQNQMISFLFI